MTGSIAKRICALQEKMRREGIQFYLVPTADFHQSEYVGEYFKSRRFITGFTGSAGTALIGLEEACLWTDGRYFLQAEEQLKGTGIRLMKMGEPQVPTILEYLEEHIQEGQKMGFDGRVVSLQDGKRYNEIAKNAGASIRYDLDLIDEIWEDRPAMSEEEVYDLDLCYAGESAKSKIARVREKMEEVKAKYQILTTLDDICWMLNIRGNDIEYFPLVLSYALVTMEKVELFVKESKIPSKIKERFKEENIELHPYQAVYERVKELEEGSVVLLDPQKLNYTLYKSIPCGVKKIEKRNPQILFKSVKNEVELQNIRKAQIKDGVAHVRFMKWLKENVGKERITEMQASDRLDEFRKEMGGYIQPSFDPIAAAGEHGAIVHYSATKETDKELEKGMLFMTDTGAGYYEGSTDITRTYALGEVPKIMKEHFTVVAVSNLRLADTRFLYGCTGAHLDAIARAPFWQRGLNYNHGTGHGVGYLLNIHEGPCTFSWKGRSDSDCRLEEGMVITDEPGIYIAGSHGIRLENELLVRKGEKNEYGQFMYLEPISFIPMDLDAIDPDVMTKEDKELLNQYHSKVYEVLCEYLSEEERTWLKHYTRAI